MYLQFAAFKFLGAEGIEGTFGAERSLTLADITSVQQEPVVGISGFMVGAGALG